MKEEKINKKGESVCEGSQGVTSLCSSDDVILHSSEWGKARYIQDKEFSMIKTHLYQNGWKTLECNTDTLINYRSNGAQQHLGMN